MLEYLSEAIVLNKEPNGDLDTRVSLFTKKFGKLVAKAKSARRITSKLSPHLEPGNLIDVRLVEKNGLQVVDALKKDRLHIEPADLYNLHLLFAEAEPDSRLWHDIKSENIDWRKVLAILGWDPRDATCQMCGKGDPQVFRIKSQEFFCKGCASKVAENDLLYIH